MLASSSKWAASVPLRSSIASSSRLYNFLFASKEETRCLHHRRHASTLAQPAFAGRPTVRPYTHNRSEPGLALGPDRFHSVTPQSRYNTKLQDFRERGRVAEAIEVCTAMKKEKVSPNSETYNYLLSALADAQMHHEAWAVFLDMQAMGFKADIEVFNTLLYSVRGENVEYTDEILKQIQCYGLSPNLKTYDLLVAYYILGNNFEMALQKIAEMDDLGLTPSLEIAQMTTIRAAEHGYTRLAHDLADVFESTSFRRFDVSTWVHLLSASAQNLYPEGVQRSWKKVVKEYKIQPTEGLCLDVLHTAARHGMPALAADALSEIEALGVPYRELHFAYMLEAFVVKGQLKEAFQVLELIRESDNVPTLDTVQPIQRIIERDPDAVDNAYALLEELKETGHKVDILAANVIIKAATVLNDLQRGIGVYKALPDLNLKADATTYSLLLESCLQNEHRELADRLWQEMKTAGVTPDADAYKTYILLILKGADYEEAFFYLEEMKALQLQPSYQLYFRLIARMVSSGDSRYKLAVEEMKQMGYHMGERLQDLISMGGRSRYAGGEGPHRVKPEEGTEVLNKLKGLVK